MKLTKISINDDISAIATQGKACRVTTENNIYRALRKMNKNLPKLSFFEIDFFCTAHVAWAVQKKSVWKESINQHILLHHQNGFLVKSQSALFSAPNVMEEESDLKALGIEHFMGPIIIGTILILIAITVFVQEICCKKFTK